MVTIEFNGVKIDVPSNWEDVTVGHYESFYLDNPETTRERVGLIAKVCKVDVAVLLEWPAEVFNIIVERCDFLFTDNDAKPDPTIKIGEITYVVPIEDKLTLGAYVDADAVQKDGDQVLSQLLAIVCRPPGEEYNYENSDARAAMFAALPVSEVLGVLAFFLQCSAALMKRTKAFTNLAQAVESLPPTIRNSPRRGGGIRLLWTWRATRYMILTKQLNWRLQKLLLSYNTSGIKGTRTRRKTN